MMSDRSFASLGKRTSQNGPKLFVALVILLQTVPSVCLSSAHLRQGDAKPLGTDSLDSKKSYSSAISKMHATHGNDDFECQDIFLRAIQIMDKASLADLNRQGPVNVRQINAWTIQRHGGV
jgi:hypothetical protein